MEVVKLITLCCRSLPIEVKRWSPKCTAPDIGRLCTIEALFTYLFFSPNFGKCIPNLPLTWYHHVFRIKYTQAYTNFLKSAPDQVKGRSGIPVRNNTDFQDLGILYLGFENQVKMNPFLVPPSGRRCPFHWRARWQVPAPKIFSIFPFSTIRRRF